MNEPTGTTDKISDRTVLGIFILAAALVLSIGLGFLLGAGAGWIFFGLFLLLVVIGNAKKIKAAQ
jgi:hypothetical protein